MFGDWFEVLMSVMDGLFVIFLVVYIVFNCFVYSLCLGDVIVFNVFGGNNVVCLIVWVD